VRGEGGLVLTRYRFRRIDGRTFGDLPLVRTVSSRFPAGSTPLMLDGEISTFRPDSHEPASTTR
jgi:hypothetical protein